MNTMQKLLAALGLTAALTAPAMAGTIPTKTSLEVGSLDPVLNVTSNLAASNSAETAWVSSILTGASVSSSANSVSLYTVSGASAGTYAIDLSSYGSPSYVLLKDSSTTLLVQNTGLLGWLVFRWEGETIGDQEYDLNGDRDNTGQRSINHLAIVDYTASAPPHLYAVATPEPATLGLMGFGLVAAGLRRRKAT